MNQIVEVKVEEHKYAGNMLHYMTRRIMWEKVETINKLKGQFEDFLFKKNIELIEANNLLKYEYARKSEVLNQLNGAELKIYELDKANGALKLKLKFILDMKDELK